MHLTNQAESKIRLKPKTGGGEINISPPFFIGRGPSGAYSGGGCVISLQSL